MAKEDWRGFSPHPSARRALSFRLILIVKTDHSFYFSLHINLAVECQLPTGLKRRLVIRFHNEKVNAPHRSANRNLGERGIVRVFKWIRRCAALGFLVSRRFR